MRSVLITWMILCCVTITAAQPPYLLEASVDTTTPYVGQPVIYTLRLYQQQEAGDIRFLPPPFAGFGQSSDEFVTQTGTSRNNQTYRVTEQQYILYSSAPGEQTIAPFRVMIPETPFQPGAELQTSPVTLNIQPLPADAPANFTNAVGQYDIQSSVDPERDRTGNLITFRLSVTGSGNLEQVNAPDVNFPPELDVFSEQPQFNRESITLATKEFRWSLVAEQPGSITIPSVSFTFFNPQTAAYTTRRTAPVSITITGSTNNTPSTVTPTPQTTVTPSATTADTPAENTLPQQSADRTFSRFFPVVLLTGMLFIVLIISLGVLYRRNRTQNKSISAAKSPAKKSATLKDVQRRLKAASQQPPKEAHQRIEQILLSYLGTDRDNVDSKIAHLPLQIQQYLLDCLNDAGSRRYAPVSRDDVHRLIHRVNRVIQAIERQK